MNKKKKDDSSFTIAVGVIIGAIWLFGQIGGFGGFLLMALIIGAVLYVAVQVDKKAKDSGKNASFEDYKQAAREGGEKLVDLIKKEIEKSEKDEKEDPREFVPDVDDDDPEDYVLDDTDDDELDFDFDDDDDGRSETRNARRDDLSERDSFSPSDYSNDDEKRKKQLEAMLKNGLIDKKEYQLMMKKYKLK